MTEQSKAKIENLDQQEEEELTPEQAAAAGGLSDFIVSSYKGTSSAALVNEGAVATVR
jgi:hypothetical protein